MAVMRPSPNVSWLDFGFPIAVGQEAEFHDIICGFVIGGRGEISEGGRSMLSGKQGELSLVLLTCQFRYRKEPAYLDYDVKLYLSAS
jgi:hypothetical protein